MGEQEIRVGQKWRMRGDWTWGTWWVVAVDRLGVEVKNGPHRRHVSRFEFEREWVRETSHAAA